MKHFVSYVAAFVLVELGILIFIGSWIGALETILYVLLTGIGGAILARINGLDTMARMRQSLRQGILPAAEIFQGALILIGAILLIIPGFITDLAGIILMLPFARKSFGRWLSRFINRNMQYREIVYPELD